VPHSPPLPVELSPEAELDFIDILIYTERTFGDQQKDIYADWIDTALSRIASNPEFGKPIAKPEYFRYHISWAGNRGSHYVYYRITDDALKVARILHQSRDYMRLYPFNE
jgi:toxin ParE1/3/4